MRLDATPLKGGGYRLTVTSPLAARSPFVSVDLRPRRRGGISFDIESCLRFAK